MAQDTNDTHIQLENLEVRDWLALDRTLMSNERTFLSYMRTALGLAAAGAALIKLFPDETAECAVGATAIVAGLGLAVLGLRRFQGVRNRYHGVFSHPDYRGWRVRHGSPITEGDEEGPTGV